MGPAAGVDMKPIVRWLMAALVAVAAFAVAAWVCGAQTLSALMKDAGIRWDAAGSLGGAVAALAALCGHSFPTGGQPAETVPARAPASAPMTTTTGSGDTRNEISNGTFYGPVIQGLDITGPISTGTAPSADSRAMGR
jgi:hypothetical protein